LFAGVREWWKSLTDWIRATPERFDLLDEREISSDSTWAHLAVCGQKVFVRELGAVSASRWELPTAE
jgi:hypothetical protein